MATLNFNAAQVPTDFGAQECVPAGWYNVMVDETEMKPTKDGSGAYLQVRFTVLDGQYVNRKIFTRMNLQNSNPTAQEIAYKQLSALCHAVNVLQLQDSVQLHGLPLKVKVKVRKDSTGQYEDQNEVTAYKNINEHVDMQAAPATPTGFGAQIPGATPFTAPAPAPVVPQGFAPQPQQVPTPPAPQPAQFAPPPQQPWAQQPAATAPAPAQTAVPPWAQPPQR